MEIFGALRRQTRWTSRFLSLVSLVIHGRTTLLSELILAQWSGSTAGKLDLPLGLSRHPVARGRTISPAANRLQNVPIAGGTCALKDQRAVHAPVGPDDKGDLRFPPVVHWIQDWLWRGQSLRRPDILAARARRDVRHIAELRIANASLPQLALALF